MKVITLRERDEVEGVRCKICGAALSTLWFDIINMFSGEIVFK